MLNDKEEKILSIVRMSGPILPIKISKSMDMETYLASAILSSLVSNGHLKLSQKKIGASPLYFIAGQEERVRGILLKELKDLEKKVIDRLRELKVAFEDELYPQERFLLKELKDFATLFSVKIGDKEKNVWKYNSVSDEDLNSILNEKINGKIKKVEEETQVPEKIERVEEESTEAIEEKIKEEIPQPEESKTEAVETTEEVKKEVPKEDEKTIEKEIELPVVKKEPKKRKAKKPNEFLIKVRQHLEDKNAEISKEELINSKEQIFNIELKTDLGPQNFIVKVKDKKTLSESDISQFYLECMHHKTQGIMFVPKEPTKKLNRFLDKHMGKLVRVIVIN